MSNTASWNQISSSANKSTKQKGNEFCYIPIQRKFYYEKHYALQLSISRNDTHHYVNTASCSKYCLRYMGSFQHQEAHTHQHK